MLEIPRAFSRSDSWEKRQIVQIADKHITEDEKRPWLKNVKTQESGDLFLVERIRASEKKRLNRRSA